MTCAGITHNLLRAAATLASRRHGKARGSTLRRELINIPARLAHRGRDQLILHLPQDWPWHDGLRGRLRRHPSRATHPRGLTPGTRADPHLPTAPRPPPAPTDHRETDKPQNRQRPTTHGQLHRQPKRNDHQQPNDHSEFRRWIEAEWLAWQLQEVGYTG